MNEVALYRLAQAVGEVLRDRGKTLAAAESCTGGWLAQSVTAVPGSSEWFDCGFVTYSNRSKVALLGVPETVLSEHGAVSAETVRAMAFGALERSGADLAVAISGIAGPSGGTPEKPVGTVWLAWFARDGTGRTSGERFPGDRRAIRYQAVECALRGIRDFWPA